MKQNQASLTYFTIGETIQCFVKSSKDVQQSNPSSSNITLIEENDVVNYILQEMVNQNIAEATESQRLAIDYVSLY